MYYHRCRSNVVTLLELVLSVVQPAHAVSPQRCLLDYPGESLGLLNASGKVSPFGTQIPTAFGLRWLLGRPYRRRTQALLGVSFSFSPLVKMRTLTPYADCLPLRRDHWGVDHRIPFLDAQQRDARPGRTRCRLDQLW